MAIAFRLDERNGDIRLVIEDIVGAFGLPTSHELAPDDDPPFGKPDFLTNLRQLVPSSARFTAGVMNLVQMSRSLRDFLSRSITCEHLAHRARGAEEYLFSQEETTPSKEEEVPPFGKLRMR